MTTRRSLAIERLETRWMLALPHNILIDHNDTNINTIPQADINNAKADLHIAYGHTSHGSQVTDGMTGLVDFANAGGRGLALPANIFAWNDGGTGGALDLHDYAMEGDAGYYPDWYNNTRAYLDAPANADVNVIIWAWCGQLSWYTQQNVIDQYLTPMSTLEADYPNVAFVYMTGHLDGTGLTGNLHLRNQQIRDYCQTNSKILYDFEDIESYDPSGVYYGDRIPNDNCDYDSDNSGEVDQNWATNWQASHTENVDWYNCGAAHTQPLNANRKAYAAWALWTQVADWRDQNAARDSLGLYNPASSTFFLNNANQAGNADATFGYGPPGGGWTPVVGDWDGNGTDTVGLFNPTNSVFYLRNTNNAGIADAAFGYGPPGGGWTPVVGDWDGNGTDTVGLFDPTNSVFYLRNTNDAGVANTAFGYGPPGGGWTPVVGDWNGVGADTIGLFNPVNSVFYLRDTNDAGTADRAFGYGPPASGWTPVVGDWNADGTDTIGLFNGTSSVVYMRNTNDAGVADSAFGYGPPASGWTPVRGDWNGSGTSPLLAAGGEAAPGGQVAALLEDQLQPIVEQAVADWASLGLAADRIDALRGVRFVIADLPGARLGMAEANTVYLDINAAGHGWFVDPTPGADEEFRPTGSGLGAVDPRAVDRIDLLTTVSHELGHTLGLGDLAGSVDRIMNGLLPTGVRREPGVAEFDAVIRSTSFSEGI